MADIEELLRTELTGPVPELGLETAGVLSTLERHRRRRMLVGGVAAAVAVGLVAALGVALAPRGGGHAVTPPTVAPTSPPPSSAAGIVVPGRTPAPGQKAELGDVKFADAQHGYAIVYRCPPGSTEDTKCTPTLAITADGARTWTYKPVPGALPPGGDGTGLELVGPVLVIDATWQGHKRWISTDQGDTWQPQTVDPNATVPAMPPGGSIFVESRKFLGAGTGTGEALYALGPDGTGGWLTNQPDLTNQIDAPIRAAGGAWWMMRAPTESTIEIAVSRDAGRSWQRRTMTRENAGRCQLAPGGHTDELYLACANGTDSFEHSTDGGKTWRPAAELTGELPTLAEVGGGGLLAQERKAWPLHLIGADGHDDTVTFDGDVFDVFPVPGAPGMAWVFVQVDNPTSGNPPNITYEYYFTSDGRTWWQAFDS